MPRQVKLTNKQLILYTKWFDALMAVENPPSDATVEDRTKLLTAMNKAKHLAREAGVPNI